MADRPDRLIIFDTSALEACYLAPLLRGKECTDVRAVIRAGYQPAVLRGTVHEIWLHAKLGSGNSASWAPGSNGYPGSIAEMINLINQRHPKLDAGLTAYFWFNQCEEWRSCSSVQCKFLKWKRAMVKFCRSIESCLEQGGFKIIEPRMRSLQDHQEALRIQQDLAFNSLIPSEDVWWLVEAVLLNAKAIVLGDDGVLTRGRLSMGISPAPCAVHYRALRKALETDFVVACYPAPERGEGARLPHTTPSAASDAPPQKGNLRRSSTPRSSTPGGTS